MKTKNGKVTALDATRRAVRIDRHWFDASEQEFKRLRLDDKVEVTYVNQAGRRKVIEIKVILNGAE